MIRITKLHRQRVFEQVQQNLIGLQRDMATNARTHKAMAQAKSPDAATLRSFVADCATQYLRRLQWVIDLRSDPARRTRLVEAAVAYGWAESDLVDVVTDLRAAAIALRGAPRSTYAEIIAACDAVIATVDMPESLWPE